MNAAKNQAFRDMITSGISPRVLAFEHEIVHFEENVEEIQIFLKIKKVTKPIKSIKL